MPAAGTPWTAPASALRSRPPPPGTTHDHDTTAGCQPQPRLRTPDARHDGEALIAPDQPARIDPGHQLEETRHGSHGITRGQVTRLLRRQRRLPPQRLPPRHGPAQHDPQLDRRRHPAVPSARPGSGGRRTPARVPLAMAHGPPTRATSRTTTTTPGRSCGRNGEAGINTKAEPKPIRPLSFENMIVDGCDTTPSGLVSFDHIADDVPLPTL